MGNYYFSWKKTLSGCRVSSSDTAKLQNTRLLISLCTAAPSLKQLATY